MTAALEEGRHRATSRAAQHQSFWQRKPRPPRPSSSLSLLRLHPASGWRDDDTISWGGGREPLALERCCPPHLLTHLVAPALTPSHLAGQEFIIPSLAHRFIAEMVDFFILFFIKATIVLSIMHLSGIKDISKFAMHYIIEEIDEDTSMEDLQKMMIVALIYRMLVCFYEIICIWGAGGATPGKFLLGLRVVTCDTSVLIAPSRVLVIPSSNVSITTSTIRALIKNFSIASFFPAFITLLFFQHNRTAYDIVAGTIVVKRNGVR
uniref:Family with sequence similarity 8 member A1 n=1 Tax=Crocodylus porosus TaxID=8502 RepID=A0A7M4E2Z6_CROPO